MKRRIELWKERHWYQKPGEREYEAKFRQYDLMEKVVLVVWFGLCALGTGAWFWFWIKF